MPRYKRVGGGGPSAQAETMAAADAPANQQLDAMRNAAPARMWAAVRLTGELKDDATGLGRLTASGGLDIFRAASGTESYGQVGENPYNNFLANNSYPQVDIYPTHVGLYFGVFGAAADQQDVLSGLIENSWFELKVDNAPQVIQPCITLAAGLAMARRTATTADDVTYTTEQFGPTSPQHVFALPKGTKFTTKRQLKAILQVSQDCADWIATLTGSFPDAGSVIGVCMFGTQALRVGTQR